MLKRIIPILGAATAVAAFCLVAFQLFWISEAKKIKEESFNATVNTALDQLVADMEKDEIIFHVVNDISPRQGYTFRNARSGIRSLQKDQQLFTVDLFDSTSIKKHFSPIKDPATIQMLHNTLVDIDKQQRAQQHEDSEQKKIDEKLNYKKVLVDNIVEKIISVEVPIEQRINKEKIEESLALVFQSYGLNLNFDYAVRHPDGELLFGSEHEVDGDFYKRQLFPSDLLSEQYFLTVNFPRKQTYIYKAMGATIFISLALLIVVIGVFFSTLMAVFRQKKLAQMRSDFTNNMTHELKTPIATISLAAEMLNDPNIPAEKKNYPYLSGMISEQTKKLSFLVERTLQLSMFENRKMSFKIQHLDFHKMAETVIASFALQTESKGAHIAQAFNATNAQIDVDELHFSNIFANLIDNALKYSDKDPMIVVATKNVKDKLVIEVRDNGIGMTSEDQKRIFEQFYRVHTGNLHNVKGFGLGLSYVKRIVEELKGEIKIESKLGKGSNFVIIMPLSTKM